MLNAPFCPTLSMPQLNIFALHMAIDNSTEEITFIGRPRGGWIQVKIPGRWFSTSGEMSRFWWKCSSQRPNPKNPNVCRWQRNSSATQSCRCSRRLEATSVSSWGTAFSTSPSCFRLSAPKEGKTLHRTFCSLFLVGLDVLWRVWEETAKTYLLLMSRFRFCCYTYPCAISCHLLSKI